MSLKKKMKDLLESYPGYGKNRESEAPAQGSSKKAGVQVLEKGSGAAKGSKEAAGVGPKKGAFEEKPMKQGDSKDADVEELEPNGNQGKSAFAKALPKAGLTARGAGKADKYIGGIKDVADPTSVINKKSSAGNVHQEETEVEGEEQLTEEELDEKKENPFEKKGKKDKDEDCDDDDDKDDEDEDDDEDDDKKSKKKEFMKTKKEELERDVSNLFDGEIDLTEEFKGKAASLFEAAVVARVAHEVSLVEDAVAEKAVAIIAEQEIALIEKLDEYLSYVAEQWVANNEVGVGNMLRTEIAEGFMEGIRNTFAEHYIEVPEEKYNVIGEMQEAIDQLESERDEVIQDATELAEELIALKRVAVVSQVTEGMAKTSIEKFSSLVEEVTYEDDKSFAEKLEIVKKNLFGNNSSSTPSVIEEEVEGVVDQINESADPEIRAIVKAINGGKSRF